MSGLVLPLQTLQTSNSVLRQCLRNVIAGSLNIDLHPVMAISGQSDKLTAEDRSKLATNGYVWFDWF